jgi:probable F420-dependent oxidoreductase
MAGLIFGVDVPTSGVGDPITLARQAEALGFDFISANDHVLGPEPRFEGWTLLSWLAASTSRIQVASRVIGVPYREPVLLAKMAESFDRLSGGRLILGLGAGSGEAEYRAMGLAPATLVERVGALEEAIAVIKGLWTEAELSYRGRRYRTNAAQMEPKPRRPIPIWLGTVGPRGLRLVGQVADGWIPSLPYAPPERAPQMIAAILAAAAKAGRNPTDISRIYNLEVSLEPGQVAELVGEPGQIAEQLIEFARIGFTGFNFQPVGAKREEQIERLAHEVVPVVRQGL